MFNTKLINVKNNGRLSVFYVTINYIGGQLILVDGNEVSGENNTKIKIDRFCNA